MTSRPLQGLDLPILNTSQNWYAEMTLKQLGKQFGRAGSWEEGFASSAASSSTRSASTPPSSRSATAPGCPASNLVSPLAFTQLLRFMRRIRTAETFAAGLPQSGSAGSLRNRFLGTPIEGRVRAKTGTISRTNTLSGYVELDERQGR